MVTCNPRTGDHPPSPTSFPPSEFRSVPPKFVGSEGSGGLLIGGATREGRWLPVAACHCRGPTLSREWERSSSPRSALTHAIADQVWVSGTKASKRADARVSSEGQKRPLPVEPSTPPTSRSSQAGAVRTTGAHACAVALTGIEAAQALIPSANRVVNEAEGQTS